jgi:two-component system, NtrC family, sensor histidine kinase KinB
MKTTIKSKFILGIIFFFLIICFLSFVSAFYMNKLAKKTNAILKENHASVIYARNMSENITDINQEILNSYVNNKLTNQDSIKNELQLFRKSLELEKNNITEIGEDKIASNIENEFNTFNKTINQISTISISKPIIISIQNISTKLHQQLISLSQLNEKAIEYKTNDAKISAKNALTHITILVTICLLITLSFTFSFISYFNKRFTQLFNGIKEIGANNYSHRLYFNGNDEFHEISLIFNDLAEKLDKNSSKIPVTLQEDYVAKQTQKDIQELKNIINEIRFLEGQANNIISKLESKN